MKKPLAERLGDFMAGKGFYIVLFLCLAAIGISGYYLYSSVDLTDSPVAATARVTVTPSASPALHSPVTAVTPTQSAAPASPTPSPAEEEAAASPSPAPSATPAPTPSATPAAFVWPVQGEVISVFSSQTLAYDQTMGDWRTHGGVDIAAPLGQQVLAVSAGTVIDVFADDLMGTTVVIDHGDGLTSTYANLAAKPTVETGDTVRTGDVLGAVGDTAIAESAQASHLHLEMAENGSPVNPADYLP